MLNIYLLFYYLKKKRSKIPRLLNKIYLKFLSTNESK